MAISVDISSRLNIDTSDAENKLRQLGQNGNFQSLVQPTSAQPLSTDNSNILDNPIDTENENVEEAKISNDLLNNIYDLLQNKTTQESYYQEQAKQKNYNHSNNAISMSENTFKQLLNLNFADAARGAVTNTGKALQNEATSISKESGDGATSDLANTLGKLGTAGLVAGAVIGVATMAGKKVMGEYEKTLPDMEKMYGAYGFNISSNGAKLNSDYAITMAKNIQPYIRGTGLTNGEFMAQSVDYARYGVSDYMEAGKSTRSAINMSRLTGADFDEIQKLQGLSYRYGGISGSTTVDKLYEQASKNGVTVDDLHKYMPELIANITNAMEIGIENGFTRSVEDVADSVSFISNLSPNEAWKHNAGKTFTSMTQGLSGAVDLSSTNDIITFQAIANMSQDDINKALGDTGSTGNSYLDKALILENGATPALVKAIHKQVQNTYGENDVLSGVLSYKDMYGLNTKGAYTLYQALSNPNTTEIEKDEIISNITSDSQYKSDSTEMRDALNDVNINVAKMGQDVYQLKTSTISIQGDVADGLNRLAGYLGYDEYHKVVSKYSDQLFDKDEKDFKKNFENEIELGLARSEDGRTYQTIIDYLGSLGSDKLESLNLSNQLNNIDWYDGEKALQQLMAIGGENGENVQKIYRQAPTYTKEEERIKNLLELNPNLNDEGKELLFNQIVKLGNAGSTIPKDNDIASQRLSNDILTGMERLRDLSDDGSFNDITKAITEVRDLLLKLNNDGLEVHSY